MNIKLTAEQVERAFERWMDGMDARLMNGDISQGEYDQRVKDMNAACDATYRRFK
jgi:hypothetical protein